MTTDSSRMIRRTINWPVLVASVVIVAAVAGGLYLLHDYRLGQTAGELLEMAKQQEEKSDWFKAADYLNRYTRLRPDDIAAKGRLALDFGRYAKDVPASGPKVQGVGMYYRALSGGQTEQEIPLRLGLLELLLEVGRFPEAERESKKVLEREPENPLALRALALSLYSQLANGSIADTATKDQQIVKTMEVAQKLNPSDALLATVISTVFRQYPLVVQAEYPGLSERQRQSRADQNFDQFVQKNAESGSAYLARSVYRSKYGLPGADADLENAIRLAPEDPDVVMATAMAEFARSRTVQSSRDEAGSAKHLVKAKSHFEKLVGGAAGRHSEQAYLGLGDTFLLDKQFERAVETWQKGLGKFKATTTLIGFHARIAEAAMSQGRQDLAAESLDAIDQLLGKIGGSIPREAKVDLQRGQDLRRASWHLKKADFAAAVPLLRQVIVSQPSGDKNIQLTLHAWMQLGGVSANRGEWSEAASAFDQAASLEPDAVVARLAASTSWLNAGRPDLANERAEQALQHTDVADAWLALAAAQIRLQSQLPTEQQSWLRLETALDKLGTEKQQLAEPWRVEFLRVEHVLAKAKSANDTAGGVRRAVELLQAAEQRYPDEPTFWSQLAVAYQSLNDPESSAHALAAVRRLATDPSEAALLEARLASLGGDPAKAQRLLQLGLKSVSPRMESKMREELINATLLAKERSKARNMLVVESERQPQNVATLRRLAELDLEDKNLEGMKAWESKLQALGPAGEPYARYYRVCRLFQSTNSADEQNLHECLRELEQVLLARPTWAEASTLRGAVEQRLGRKTQAVAAYERAIQLGERRLQVFEQLIALLDGLKRTAEVDRYLTRLEAEVPLSQRLAEFAMNYQSRQDRPQEALEIAQTRAKQRPDDPVAQLWLGRLLSVGKKFSDAETPLLRAIELSPGDERPWNVLVECYASSGQKDRLHKLIDQLNSQNALDAGQKELVLARCHEFLGNREEAERHYTRASEAAPMDAGLHLRVAQYFLRRDPSQAKLHLESALKLEPSLTQAKQMLAIAHTALGENEQAAELLSVANERGLVAAGDIRLNALLLLQRGGPANLAEAATKLEELLGREADVASDHATDRLLLAQVYEQQSRIAANAADRDDRLKAGEEQLRQVGQDAAATPMQQAALIQFYLRHDRKSEAAAALDQLDRKVEAAAKKDASIVGVLAALWLQQGSPQRAEKWLTTFESVETNPLRVLALKAQCAVALDANKDLLGIVNPPARSLFEAATGGEDRQRIAAGVGDIYSSLKHPAGAEEWYRLLWNEDPLKYAPLANALQRQGKFSEAIELCSAASRVDASVQPYLALANILVEGKPTAEDFQAAEVILSEGLKRFESDARMLNAVGMVRLLQKRDADAVALFRKVVAASPQSVSALNNLAMLLAENPNDRAEALKLIDKAIAIAGEDSSLLDTKGAILLYSGRSADAVPILESATRDAGADPRHHFHLALAYRDLGKLEGAKQQLETALSRDLATMVLTNMDVQLLAELRTALKL